MLRTILVDANEIYAETLREFCEQTQALEIKGVFFNSEKALNYARENIIDFALLDVELPNMDGIDLGKKLRELYPDIILIYVTENRERCIDAMLMKADYYIFKPYDRKDIAEVVERAQYLSLRQKKKVKINVFGRFDVFVKGEALYFPNAKSKELLAVCVDRKGGEVTMEQVVDKLWSDKPYDEKVKRLYRKAVMSLRQVLAQHDISDIFVSERGCCHVNVKKFECDYYTYLQNPIRNRSMLQDGDYMFEYSWAEETAAKLYFDLNDTLE